MKIHTRKRAIFMRSVARRNDSFGADTEGFALSSQRKAQITSRNDSFGADTEGFALSSQRKAQITSRNDSFGADTEGFALSSQRKLSVLLVVGIVILSAKDCDMKPVGPGGDKPVTFAYICTNGTKAEGTAEAENTEKCSACETGFALSSANECATDSDSDGTADNVDAFPFDAERTAGICGELSPSVVAESGSESEQMTKRTANDATGKVYVAKDPRLIASGSGHRDDPFIIPLSDGCRSINFVWEFRGLTIPDTVTDGALMSTSFADIGYHYARFTNLPAASTIYAQTTLIDKILSNPLRDMLGFGTLRDTMINGDERASLRYGVSSITGTSSPSGKGQEHELAQNFLDIRYATGPRSAQTSRNTDGRIRFRVLIEETSE